MNGIDLNDAASQAGCSQRTLAAFIHAEDVLVLRIGGRRLVSREIVPELAAFARREAVLVERARPVLRFQIRRHAV